jgi:ADP-dependent glucokinase
LIDYLHFFHLQKILQEINSLGLNEQELLFLAHADERAPHSNYYLEISDQPELFKVIDILEYILTTYGQSVRNSGSRLTRIHFHSLSFHLIAEVTTGGRDNKEPWSNSVAALMSGAKIASKQACGFEFYDEESNRQLESLVELKIAYDFDKTNSKNIFFTAQDGGQNRLLQLNSSHPVLELNRGNIKFLYTPVLVCKRPSKTVGLGDAISSSGLLYAMLNSEI